MIVLQLRQAQHVFSVHRAALHRPDDESALPAIHRRSTTAVRKVDRPAHDTVPHDA